MPGGRYRCAGGTLHLMFAIVYPFLIAELPRAREYTSPATSTENHLPFRKERGRMNSSIRGKPGLIGRRQEADGPVRTAIKRLGPKLKDDIENRVAGSAEGPALPVGSVTIAGHLAKDIFRRASSRMFFRQGSSSTVTNARLAIWSKTNTCAGWRSTKENGCRKVDAQR